MSVCAQKSVALQRDTISNLQQTVDDSAKVSVTYFTCTVVPEFLIVI